MVEVFKTDVSAIEDAKRLILQIHQNFDHYLANFDLDDCDRILRIQCAYNSIPTEPIMDLLKRNGFNAEVLVDDGQSVTNTLLVVSSLVNKKLEIKLE